MKLYDSCRNAIRISFFAFLLISFGTIIQSENVNIFYTFSNNALLVLAEGSIRLGRTIITNLPIIFMTNIVCKKANSGFPIILALIGYFTYMITMSLFAQQSLVPYAYNTYFGTLLNASESSNPFETGMVGAFVVAYATRISFVTSRKKNRKSVFGLFNSDTMAIIYEIVLCALLGLLAAYLFPIAFNILQKGITYVGNNLADSRRLALYGIGDRVLSILGQGNLIRYPFWYTSAGGSYSSIVTGQIVNGDVNIWNYIQDATSTFVGAGRFITPYYVINMFIVPAIYLGMYFSMSDAKEKRLHLLPLIALIIVSIACGNPLPLELSLLFTAPLLLFIYLIVVGVLFWLLASKGIFLGFANVGGDIATAMPGSFADYIINIRDIKLSSSVSGIFVVGIIAAAIMFAITILYYRYFAYDLSRSGKIEKIGNDIIDAVGGIQNISNCSNAILKLSVELYDSELSSSSKMQKINVKRIFETKGGYSLDLGTSSCVICKYIKEKIKEYTKSQKT